MNFTENELREAKSQIDSTLRKLRETVKTFEIAKALIEAEIETHSETV